MCNAWKCIDSKELQWCKYAITCRNFNYLSFTKLQFVNSDIKDSDAQNLKGINHVDCLRLYNCPNIIDQGVTILAQNINPNCLPVSYCPNITNGIQTCKDIINADHKPEKPKPKTAKPEPVPEPKHPHLVPMNLLLYVLIKVIESIF